MGTEPTTTDDVDVDELIAGLVALGSDLPFNRHMGVTVVEVTPGHTVTRLAANADLANHLGGVHAIATLAPAELAGALAASSRLAPLVVRGYVPVAGGLSARYRAPAVGALTATADVPEDALASCLADADAGQRPRVTAPITVTDAAGLVVAEVELHIVYIDAADADARRQAD
ncbi:DUF4442 domain-containing protein [Nitriliruptoraceae bacterium ZYF776]|nr:DUF4442 domain-containing protein [Profundirhabdus halotolerans]